MTHRGTVPTPMPDVARALVPMKDAGKAIQRGLEAWNASQLADAIRSAEFFLDKAKRALPDENAGKESQK